MAGTVTYKKPKMYDILMTQKAIALRQQSIVALLEKLHPDDPIRPIVEAMGALLAELAEMKAHLTEMKVQMSDAAEREVLEAQEQPKPAPGNFRFWVSGATQATAQALSHMLSKDHRLEYITTISLSLLVFAFALAGMAVGTWFSEGRSAEARRYWDWNKGLIAECQKQKKKTCNIHVVPPEQW
jgi:hypothetical protein